MIQMTQHINADWKTHVAETGVTCYTCHRGNTVPAEIWFTAEPQNKRADFIGNLQRAEHAGHDAWAWPRCPTTRSRPTC